jgi:putative transposase
VFTRSGLISSINEQVWFLKQNTGSGVAIEIWLAAGQLVIILFRKAPFIYSRKYKVFVAEGKGQISPWTLLKNQIFLGDESFVEEMEAKINKDSDLTEFRQVKQEKKRL